MKQKFEANRLQPRDVATEFEKNILGRLLLRLSGHEVCRAVRRQQLRGAHDGDGFVRPRRHTEPSWPPRCGPRSCRWLVVSFSSDWLFPPDQSRDIVNALIANDAPVTYCNVQSDCGHDAFLLPTDLACYGELIRAFLGNLVGNTAAATDESEDEDYHRQSPTSIFHPPRLDFDRILELSRRQATVLDLGCGGGGLLARVRRTDHHRVIGVELDEQALSPACSAALT